MAGSSSSRRPQEEEGEDEADVHQVLTHRRLTTETNASGQDTTRVERKGKMRSVTTRVVKKTTTVTRGDQRMVAEAVLRTSDAHEDHVDDVSLQSGWRSSSHQPVKKVKKMHAVGAGAGGAS